jgi:hypothetical protein
MYFRRTSGWTYVAGQSAASNSSWLTRCPACSTRYRNTAKALGAKAMRTSSRQRHWSTGSSRKGPKVLMVGERLKSDYTVTQTLRELNRTFTPIRQRVPYTQNHLSRGNRQGAGFGRRPEERASNGIIRRRLLAGVHYTNGLIVLAAARGDPRELGGNPSGNRSAASLANPTAKTRLLSLTFHSQPVRGNEFFESHGFVSGGASCRACTNAG